MDNRAVIVGAVVLLTGEQAKGVLGCAARSTGGRERSRFLFLPSPDILRYTSIFSDP